MSMGCGNGRSSPRARTDGTLEMQVFHTAQLGDERTINEGILAGSIQAGIGAGAWANYVPAYNAVELPFLIKDIQHMYRLADGELGKRIADEAETKGYKVLAYYSAGEQHFQTRSKPVRNLADFQGLKIRVIQNKALVDGFQALGAVPAPLPYPQIYTAVQQGTVDGTANDLLSVTSLKLYEVAKYLTDLELRCRAAAAHRLEALLRRAARRLPRPSRRDGARIGIYERKVFEQKETTAQAEAEKGGMTFLTLSDRDKWIEKVRPAWDAFAQSTPGAAELISVMQKT